MRSRNLKPGFFKNSILGKCSYPARLFFEGLWLCADREGRIEDDPDRLKAEILPYDDEDPEVLLEELASKHDRDGNPSFIVRYTVNGGGRYIQVVHFQNHQTPHCKESESKIPPPPYPLPYKVFPESYLLNPESITHGRAKPVSAQDQHKTSTVQEQDKHSTKSCHGEFVNVLLTDQEFEKLEAKFGKEGTRDRIESLSCYIQSKGRRYKDHYATILTWERKNQPKQTKLDREMKALQTFDEGWPDDQT